MNFDEVPAMIKRGWGWGVIFLICGLSTAAFGVSDAVAKASPATFNLNFRSVGVRDVLALLAEVAGKNIIVSDSVQGVVTLRLEHTSWRQALAVLLQQRGLAMREEGEVIWVAPATELTARAEEAQNAETLQSALIPLRHAEAAEVAAMIKESANGLLSSRGRAVVDKRDNALWVQDNPQHLSLLRRFIREVDMPARQVRIEARIVSADETFERDLGITFGTRQDSGTATVAGGLNMDMPSGIKNPGHVELAVATLGHGAILDLELAAMEREGRGKVISSPSLMTADRASAAIESGEEIPYQEKTSSGATNVAFKKAVLSLKVTPAILSGRRVLLHLTVNQDKPSPVLVNGVPSIQTRALQTQAIVRDQQTLVLGGIYEQGDNHTVTRVPFLGAIPLLGALFRHQEARTDRKELLIFVTPTVVSGF